MNFLSHALPYLDRPRVAVATGIPDWLSVIDRKIRVRRRHVLPHVASHDRVVADVARGILAHIDDDRWFHGTEAFVQTNLDLAVQLRDRLPGDRGFRPMFLGHIVIEVILDSLWIDDTREHADRYFDAIESIDTAAIENALNQISPKPTDRLVQTIRRFAEAKFLFDYKDAGRLRFRMNQVMKRVGLAELPQSILPWFDETRKLVASRRERLLSPPPGSDTCFPPFG
ncbi:MAG: hypothetical protein AAF958_11950 [Planctomycetota bacterium]